MPNFVTLIAQWESELKKIEMLDPAHAIGIVQREAMIYRAIPSKIMKDIDTKTPFLLRFYRHMRAATLPPLLRRTVCAMLRRAKPLETRGLRAASSKWPE